MCSIKLKLKVSAFFVSEIFGGGRVRGRRGLIDLSPTNQSHSASINYHSNALRHVFHGSVSTINNKYSLKMCKQRRKVFFLVKADRD